jgi:heme exporter protein D
MTQVRWLATGDLSRATLVTKPGLTGPERAAALDDADATIAQARQARSAEPRWVTFVGRTWGVWVAVLCVGAYFLSRALGGNFSLSVWIAVAPAIPVAFLLLSGATVLGRRKVVDPERRKEAEQALNRVARTVREVDEEAVALALALVGASRSLEGRVHDLVWRSATRPLSEGKLPDQARAAFEELYELHDEHFPDDDD